MFVKRNDLFMIKAGILGASSTADLYARILKMSGIFDLTGCYTPDSQNSFSSKYNLLIYPSAEILFNSCDALIITDFAPDFLAYAEKAIKNFKHILITHPFLAGLDEIDYLRKLSEESGVFMQIAGGFSFQNISAENENCLLADLKHSFGSEVKSCSTPFFMEYLLRDLALVLTLLKGMPKKTGIYSWETQELKNDLISVRIELDNGSIANLLLGDLEKSDHFVLNLYRTDGVKSFESDHLSEEFNTTRVISTQRELEHFEQSIRNRYQSSFHDDIMFQALELSHRIKAKTIRNSVANFPD